MIGRPPSQALADAVAAINAIVESSGSLLDVQRALLVAQGSLSTSLQYLLDGTLTLAGFQTATTPAALQADVDAAELMGELWGEPAPAPSSGKSNKVRRRCGVSARADCKGRGGGSSSSV